MYEAGFTWHQWRKAMSRLLVLLPMLALVLTACWVSSESGEAPDPVVTLGVVTEAPDLSGQAGAPLYADTLIDSDMDADVVVAGYIVIDSNGARLCGAIAESLPPQCGPRSTRVIGIEDLELKFKEAQSVRWTETHVALWGHFVDGTLTILQGDIPTDVVIRAETSHRGTLWIQGDDVRLCTVMAASIPPLCSEPYITVIGLPEDERQYLQEYEDVQWSSGPRSLRGQLIDGVLIMGD
jgi:hypothetical protein